MDALTLMLICAGITIAAISTVCMVVMVRQQHMIDVLTDKLMARDYGEYRRNKGMLMVEERESRRPMSFYDDPGIEEEAH
jgi:hypothetical protein